MKNASKILKREIYHKSQPFSVLGSFWRRAAKLEAFHWCFVTKLNKAGIQSYTKPICSPWVQWARKLGTFINKKMHNRTYRIIQLQYYVVAYINPSRNFSWVKLQQAFNNFLIYSEQICQEFRLLVALQNASPVRPTCSSRWVEITCQQKLSRKKYLFIKNRQSGAQAQMQKKILSFLRLLPQQHNVCVGVAIVAQSVAHHVEVIILTRDRHVPDGDRTQAPAV